MCNDELSPAQRRYAADIVALHERLNFRSLRTLDRGQCSYRVERADGLVTVALRSDQLDERQLLGLAGFRLAQYLRLGWVCEEQISSRGMFCEPTAGCGPGDLHLVSVSEAGEILGYLALVATADPVPRELTDPARHPFPVEVPHHINLFHAAPVTPGVLSDQVLELKRFVHRRSMQSRVMQFRVTVELLLAAAQVLLEMPSIRLLVGDVEEHVALRHLLMVGLHVRLVDGTHPGLSPAHYLHPVYSKRAAVVPFVAEVPDTAEVARHVARLEGLLEHADLRAARAMVKAKNGSVMRVAA